MFRFFRPSSIDPEWVQPIPPEKPFFLQQAAFFSLYAPFILFLISAILGYALQSTFPWYRWVIVVYAIVYHVTIVAAFALGVIGFIGGIRHRCVEIYGCAFWGCFFNGTLLALSLIAAFGRLYS